MDEVLGACGKRARTIAVVVVTARQHEQAPKDSPTEELGLGNTTCSEVKRNNGGRRISPWSEKRGD